MSSQFVPFLCRQATFPPPPQAKKVAAGAAPTAGVGIKPVRSTLPIGVPIGIGGNVIVTVTFPLSEETGLGFVVTVPPFPWEKSPAPRAAKVQPALGVRVTTAR